MPAASIDSIVALYNKFGTEKYDEEVSQLAHALQCAALAHHENAPDDLIVAALLHDIGHLFEIEQNNGPDYRTDLRHELSGSEFLRELFPKTVTAPIAMHVDAKRYLATTEPKYYDALSQGSKRSLELQGGPYTERECVAFLERDGSTDAIRLRRWDDHGKVLDLDVPTFATWVPLLREFATST
jgi:phosphonate degradation associated HDIG domain protein